MAHLRWGGAAMSMRSLCLLLGVAASFGTVCAADSAPSVTLYHGGGTAWSNPNSLYADPNKTEKATWQDHCRLVLLASSSSDKSDVWGLEYWGNYATQQVRSEIRLGAGGIVQHGTQPVRLCCFKDVDLAAGPVTAKEDEWRIRLVEPQTWSGRQDGKTVNLVFADIDKDSGPNRWLSVVADPDCDLTVADGYRWHNFSPSNDFSQADLTIQSPALFCPMQAMDRSFECRLNGRKLVLRGSGTRLELGKWYPGMLNSGTEPKSHGIEAADAAHLAQTVVFEQGADVWAEGNVTWSIPRVEVSGGSARVRNSPVALGCPSAEYLIASGCSFTFEKAPTNKVGVAAGFRVSGGGALALPIDERQAMPSGAIDVAEGATLRLSGSGVVPGAITGGGEILVSADAGKTICLLRTAGFAGRVKALSGRLVIDEPQGGATVQAAGGEVVHSGGAIVTDLPRTGTVDVTPEAPLHVYGAGLGAGCQVNLKGGVVHFHGTEGVVAAPVVQTVPSFVTNELSSGVARFTGTVTSSLQAAGRLCVGGKGLTAFWGEVSFPTAKDGLCVQGGRLAFHGCGATLAGPFVVERLTGRVALESGATVQVGNDSQSTVFRLYSRNPEAEGGFALTVDAASALKTGTHCALEFGDSNDCVQNIRVGGTLEFRGNRTSRLGHNLAARSRILLEDGATFRNSHVFTRKGGKSEADTTGSGGNSGEIVVRGAVTWTQYDGSVIKGRTVKDFCETNAIMVRLEADANLTIDLSNLSKYQSYRLAIPWQNWDEGNDFGNEARTGWRISEGAAITVKGEGKELILGSVFGTNFTLRVADAGARAKFYDVNHVDGLKLAVAPTGEWRTGLSYLSEDTSVPAPESVTFEPGALWTIGIADGAPVALDAASIVLPGAMRFRVDRPDGAGRRAGVFAVSGAPMNPSTAWTWVGGGSGGPSVRLSNDGRALELFPRGMLFRVR